MVASRPTTVATLVKTPTAVKPGDYGVCRDLRRTHVGLEEICDQLSAKPSAGVLRMTLGQRWNWSGLKRRAEGLGWKERQ